ncbi:MAG: RagB/SusD family nutrient uptake outer membrane protein [Clostridium sp.]|nr:RagB/SusD family nutrient uptake outer membrane protein [Clostridium sp.]
MKKRLFAIPLCCAILTGLIQSCSLDIPYENQFSDPDAISTPQAARELLATAYSQLPHPEFNLSVMSDEFTPTGWIKRNADLENLYKWEPSPLRDLGTTLWQDYYAVVATLNALLERLPAIPATSDEARRQIEQIEAEAKVLKAYCYFDLLRLFGSDYRDGKDLPGILMKDRVELQFLPRTSVEGCVEGIRRLLQEASAVMQAADTPYWLGREACLYLQAEVELYTGNYKEAATLADRLLTEKGTESLTTTAYVNLWSDNSSTERIFAYYSPTMASSFYQDIVYDSSSGDYLALNETLADSYTEGDVRGEYTVYPFQYAGHTYRYMGKYNRMRKQQTEIAYINKLRTAGACFLLAEATCLDSEGDEQLAIRTINDYLTRRGAAPLEDGLKGNALMRRILTEKWKEFAGEGQRWFDLKRYRRTLLSTWATAAGKNVKSDDYRWNLPIPKEEYLYNENVVQNEGWTYLN